MDIALEYENGILALIFPKRIDFLISDSLAEALSSIEGLDIKIIILDLELTTFLTLPGAVYVVSFASHFKKARNPYVKLQINASSTEVNRFLVRIGFFEIMQVYGNLKFSSSLHTGQGSHGSGMSTSAILP